MSAVGKLLLLKGKRVSGSDLHLNEFTSSLQAMGAIVHAGHASEQVPADADVAVYTNAATEDNIERVRARELGIREMSYPELLGEITKEYDTIAISGTHGKSTTTAMIGTILEQAGFDPTVIVGSKASSFEHGNLRLGKSNWLVLEACEHMESMNKIFPHSVIVTSVEADHLDYYKNLENVISAFQKFVSQELKGPAIINADDKNSQEYKSVKNAITFGSASADYVWSNRSYGGGMQKFVISEKDGAQTQIELKVPGAFNASNATSAFALSRELGIESDIVARALLNYNGLWRRFEHVSEFNGAHIISDYGHHPTAITATLQAAREMYSDNRIVLLYEPHQHSRTKELFSDFVSCFDKADVLILSEIYRVSGRTEDENVSSRELADAIAKHNPDLETHYSADLVEAEKIARKIIKKNDVLIVMGAGDVDQVARNL